MVLVADSGSTKCAWGVIGGTGSEIRLTPGVNPVLQGREEIVRLVRDAFPEGTKAEEVRFYGAGCGERYPAQTDMLRDVLRECFGCTKVEVASDLLGAARALLGDGTGIACILGTGSNSCYYREGRIVSNVPPLGYILGDEGSGAAIGRMLLGDLLKGHLPGRLLDAFYAEQGLTYQQVIHRVYREPMANRFLASLVPFVGRHISEPAVASLVERAFREFVRRNLVHYPHDAEVACAGGVAHAFEPLLKNVMETNGFRTGRVQRSPIEGLMKYHGGETDNRAGIAL